MGITDAVAVIAAWRCSVGDLAVVYVFRLESSRGAAITYISLSPSLCVQQLPCVASRLQNEAQ